MMLLDLLILLIGVVLILAAARVSVLGGIVLRTPRGRAEALVDENLRGAGDLLSMVHDRPRTRGALVFLTVTLSVAGVLLLVAALWDDLSTWARLGFGLGVVVLAVLLQRAADSIGRRRAADDAARRAARTLRPLLVVAGPFATWTRSDTRRRNSAVAQETTNDLYDLLDLASGAGAIEQEGARMIQSVLRFNDRVVREVMVPRPDMKVLPVDASLDEARRLAVATGVSRIPVHGSSGVDDVLGLLYVKDLLPHFGRIPEPATLRSLLTMAHFVPEQKRLNVLLTEMRVQKFHMAIVVDEYGGTAGLVTLEDILEEVVGEIDDEHDPDSRAPEVRGDGSIRVAGRTPLVDLEPIIGTLDVDEADTVGGAMLSLLGRIPEPGDEIHAPDSRVHFTAVAVDGNRIETLDVRLTDGGEQPAAQPSSQPNGNGDGDLTGDERAVG